jgi:ribosomal protein S18 acetylase RimI-like enzyme
MATWRAMLASDLADVCGIAARIHSAFPESPEVFAERLHLYPDGCFVLTEGAAVVGYAISHPWRFRDPPALDTRLERIPAKPDTYYVHDVALLPSHRGAGCADAIGKTLTSHAAAIGLPSVSLIAVNGSASFWERFGFRVDTTPELEAKLRSYGASARYMVRWLS